MTHDDDNPTVELGNSPSGGDVRGVLPFSRLIQMVGAADEDDIIAAIEEDARALLELGLGAYAERYAEALDLRRLPRARQAVVEAHTQSLMKIGGVEEGKAERLAAQAVEQAASAAPNPGDARVMGGQERNSSGRHNGHGPRRPRAAFTTTIAIPIMLVLTFLFGSGFAVATLYWLGYVSTARELQLQEQILAREAERLAEEAQSIAEAKNLAADNVIKYIDELFVAAMEESMEDVHLVDAYEILMATEQIAQRFAHDPTHLERIDQVKLDEVVMPTLRLVYRIDDLGGEETMQKVRELLLQLHDRPRSDTGESTDEGPETGGPWMPPDGAESQPQWEADDRAAGGGGG